MEVRVKYFGFEPVEEAFCVTLPEGATVKDLLDQLKKERTAEEKTTLDNSTIMVNEIKSHRKTLLSDQDKVLILIPLGGG
ncbi:MoaD/ThiS family protein [Isachenkonia alkalipeptolytica]|uniref:MoaD/ThiS family protein n=1 Tax=Isachenkonia alkalipeptolytica TaxID=2565777 RepID=A0AA44BEY6_9CLOT|nr:MoaD/ThiS family protein [Isachenkonia alkalipeptolytica]NBG89443.1 MoaD/ThiS family protein [Isachenkonia alkalipeptolytica]